MAYPTSAPSAPGGDPTAAFGRRVVAALIDAALILIPTFLIVSASFHYLDVDRLDRSAQQFCDDFISDGGFCLNAADLDDRVYFSDGTGTAAPTYFWGGTFALLVVVQGLTGLTLGKLIMGLRTVGEDGQVPGLLKALVRWLLWIIDGFPYFVPLVGFIVGLSTKGHRRLGDMAAKTYVVRRSAVGSRIVVPGLTPSVGGGAYDAPGAWSASTSATGMPAPAPSAAAVSLTGPHWDTQRETYIQWDPDQRLWLQWDEGARSWSAIPGQ